MARPNASLTSLLSRLTLAASSKDYEQVLHLSNDLLSSSPADARAAKQKLIALIKLDKYKDALAFLEECVALKSQNTLLERSFCLYKLGKCAEAAKVLESATGLAAEYIRAQNVFVRSCPRALIVRTGISYGRL